MCFEKLLIGKIRNDNSMGIKQLSTVSCSHRSDIRNGMAGLEMHGFDLTKKEELKICIGDSYQCEATTNL